MSLTRVTPLRPPGHGPGAARTYIHERVFSVSSSQPLWTSLGRRQDLDRLRPFGQIHVLSSRLRDGRWCATVVLSSQHQAGRRRNCCVHKRSQTGIGEGSTAACPTHTAVDDKSSHSRLPVQLRPAAQSKGRHRCVDCAKIHCRYGASCMRLMWRCSRLAVGEKQRQLGSLPDILRGAVHEIPPPRSS